MGRDRVDVDGTGEPLDRTNGGFDVVPDDLHDSSPIGAVTRRRSGRRCRWTTRRTRRIIRAVEHSNVAAYRRTADAFRARDTQALAGLIDGEVVWHVPGTSPLAGEIRGREALFRWFDRLHEVTEGTFTLKEHDVLGTDDHVVALSDRSAVRDGVRVSERHALLGRSPARAVVSLFGPRRLGRVARRTC
jgi:uncharacterized protein